VATDFKATLWKTADKLRAQMDAAEYKHLVLGLIFLKYISDSFVKQQEKIKLMVSDPKSEFFISETPSEYESELEERDYYTQDNVFWVPQDARWESLRSKAKQPDIGSIIDSAMTSIENENTNLRGKLDKRFGRAQLGQGVLGELVDLISTIGFSDSQNASDVLGEVYEYFLGQFASAEGKKGGQFYTPAHVVKTLVAVLAPHEGRVYDPCCGSGGMFVQSEQFVKSHGGRVDDISIYGQESNPTTWRLAAMNLAIRGFSADLGKEPDDTFAKDQFPDLKFDYIMANPPFNISDWGGEKYENDPRWKYGRPPISNANYAWLQHMLWKLKPGGHAGIVLANGSLNSPDEINIRKAMVLDDVIESIVYLPSHLFLNTNIPVCLWFLSKDKKSKKVDRTGEILFIDARKMGRIDGRVKKYLTNEEILKIGSVVNEWRNENSYVNIPGFCASVKLEEVSSRNWNLEPGPYVGTNFEEEFTGEDEDLVSNSLNDAIQLTEVCNKTNKLLVKTIKDSFSDFDQTSTNSKKDDTSSENPSVHEIFDAIQNQIDDNNKLNAQLLQLRSQVFKSWFIDFRPVRLKEQSLSTGLNQKLESLFPDCFMDSPVGQIPKGWKLIPLASLFKEKKIKVGEKNIPEYSCTNKGVIPRTEKYSKKLSESLANNKVANRGDFIFGLSRSILNFGMMTDDVGCFSPAYKIYEINGDFRLSAYVYQYMIELPEYFYQIVSASSREGQKISEDTLYKLYVVFPDHDDLLDLVN
jgi:type I restriction enzyme M protein